MWPKLFAGNADNDLLSGTGGNDTISGQGGNDTLSSDAGDDALYGGDGNDQLASGNGNDTLYGDAGNDKLLGGDGNDTLDGGAGTDQMNGGLGNNTYLFGKGDGSDTINLGSGAGTLNTLQFKAGVLPSDIQLRQAWDSETAPYNSAVQVTIVSTGDSVTINGVFSGGYPTGTNNPVQQFRFDDGTVWDLTTIVAKLFAGNADNDLLSGTGGNDTISGQGGNDTLSSDAGDDALYGGDGNDQLAGGNGNDTYGFNAGDGQDTVTEQGGTDSLVLGAGIADDQLWFQEIGNNLEIDVIGTTDRVTIANWYSGNGSHIEQIKTSDGKVLLDSAVQNLVQAMAAFSPPAAGQTTLPANYQTALSTVIAANWH